MDHLLEILNSSASKPKSEGGRDQSAGRRIGRPLKTQNPVVDKSSKDFLTSTEIKQIFNEDLDSRKIVYLIQGMSKYPDLVIPDLVLTQGVARLATKASLLPMSLALRYKANPNLYIDVPKLGSVHILVYVISVLENNTDTSLIYSAVYTLLVSGSNPNLPARSKCGGLAESHTMDELKGNPSVLTWVQKKQIKFPLRKWFEITVGTIKLETEAEQLNYTQIRVRAAVLLDRYDLLEASDCIDQFDPIKYHANSIFMNLLKNSRLTRKPEALRNSIGFLNADTFVALVNDGIIPTYESWNLGKASFVNGYNTMNVILMQMQQYKDDPVITDVLLRMLIEALKNNAVFDSEQLAMLRRINSGAAEQAIKIYSVPFWSKECRIKDAAASPRFVNLASNLSLDTTMPKAVVCRKLQRISEQDVESLKAAAITRQRSRLAVNTSDITDYIEDAPSGSCINKNGVNPEEYADMDTVYYKDDSNMNWCFIRDDFDNLLKTGINPTTTKKLPKSLLAEIKYKQDRLRKIGVIDMDAMSIDKSIKVLMSEDKISSNESNELLSKVLTAIGIDRSTFDKFNNTQLSNFSAITGSRIELKGLSKKHAQFTFARAVAPTVLNDRNYAKILRENMTS